MLVSLERALSKYYIKLFINRPRVSQKKEKHEQDRASVAFGEFREVTTSWSVKICVHQSRVSRGLAAIKSREIIIESQMLFPQRFYGIQLNCD